MFVLRYLNYCAIKFGTFLLVPGANSYLPKPLQVSTCAYYCSLKLELLFVEILTHVVLK